MNAEVEQSRSIIWSKFIFSVCMIEFGPHTCSPQVTSDKPTQWGKEGEMLFWLLRESARLDEYLD